MAGIGFELRHLLRKKTWFGLAQTYAYASVIGSGPWVFSIVGILLMGLLSASLVVPTSLITQFQTSVTYLVASSLIFTGLCQLAFTRFISDRLFEKREEMVLANLHGLLLLVLGSACMIAMVVCFTVLRGQGVLYRILMISGFGLLCGVWVLTVLLSGMQRYKAIVALFGGCYALIVLLSAGLRHFGLEGLLGSFVIGHFLLFAGMWTLVLQEFNPRQTLIAFDFLRPQWLYGSLIFTGLFYNLGIWADKLMFWFYENTSQVIIGGLRASLIYDIPVFLSYLSVIPGMAVFLVRIETDFVEYHSKFFNAVREGGTLEYIESMRDEMVYAVQTGLGEIAKIQSLAVLATFVAGPSLLRWLGISDLYLPLLKVQVIGAALQVGLMAVLNVFFYLDQRRIVLWLCLQLVVLNVLLTGVSLYLGAAFYGYGFALAMLLTMCTGLHLLNRELARLEYRTFMLQ